MKDISAGLWLNYGNKKICYNPWTHFEVNDPNGDVTMCCDYPVVLGNVNEQSIFEIWNGKAYREARKKMLELGGEKMCSPDCLLLNGMKSYQSFSWYRDLPRDTDIYKNAVLNEEEIKSGSEVLQSFPRWMRFAFSFKCNFRCYHCCQQDSRIKQNDQLGDNFIEDMKKYISFYQFLFIFGGEPTILPQFKEILHFSKSNPYLRLGSVTNASNIDKCYEEIEKANWEYFDVSLDAASEKTFQKLRNPRMWKKVMSNIRLLSDLGQKKKFRVNVSMTLNSVNCHELYGFFRLCSSLNSFPTVNLVSNVGGLSFQLKYLWFSESQRKIILNHIRAIGNNFSYSKGETGLSVLEKHFEVNTAMFKLKQVAEVVKHFLKPVLPEWALKILRKIKKKLMN